MFSTLFIQDLLKGKKTSRREHVFNDIVECNKMVMNALKRGETSTVCNEFYFGELKKHYKKHEPNLTVLTCLGNFPCIYVKVKVDLEKSEQ